LYATSLSLENILLVTQPIGLQFTGGEGSNNGTLAFSSFLPQFTLSGLKKQPVPIADNHYSKLLSWMVQRY
jgi:hypothetical protein